MSIFNYKFERNQKLFFIFFTTFIFLIFYNKEFNIENLENRGNNSCTEENCSKISNNFKQQLENSKSQLNYSNLQTSINELKNQLNDLNQ